MNNSASKRNTPKQMRFQPIIPRWIIFLLTVCLLSSLSTPITAYTVGDSGRKHSLKRNNIHRIHFR